MKLKFALICVFLILTSNYQINAQVTENKKPNNIPVDIVGCVKTLKNNLHKQILDLLASFEMDSSYYYVIEDYINNNWIVDRNSKLYNYFKVNKKTYDPSERIMEALIKSLNNPSLDVNKIRFPSVTPAKFLPPRIEKDRHNDYDEEVFSKLGDLLFDGYAVYRISMAHEYSIIEKENKKGIMNKKLDILLGIENDKIETIPLYSSTNYSNVLRVSKDSKMGLFTENSGNELSFVYKNLSKMYESKELQKNIVIAYKGEYNTDRNEYMNEVCGVIDLKENIIVKFDYVDVDLYKNKSGKECFLAIEKASNKYGTLNMNGKVILPFTFKNRDEIIEVIEK